IWDNFFFFFFKNLIIVGVFDQRPVVCGMVCGKVGVVLFFSPGGIIIAGHLVFFFVRVGVVGGGGGASRPHRRLIRPAALRLQGPTGWVFSLSPWERAGVRASGRIVA
ncbi:hypothetical protein ACVGW3_00290, partial [Enterobacter hormaechei]